MSWPPIGQGAGDNEVRICNMKSTISHDWQDETPEAKARWFQSLSLDERMDMLCWFTDMVLSANPRIQEQNDAKPVADLVTAT